MFVITIYLTTLALIIFIFSTFPKDVFGQSTGYGDADNDGDVDITDYSIWLSEFVGNQAEPIYNPDFNIDGNIDGEDYIIWMKSYSQIVFTPTPTQPSGDGKLIFTSPFETGDIQCGECNPDGWNIRIDNGPSSAVQVFSRSNLPITPRGGNYSLRIHAEKTSSQTTTRAELEGWKHTFFELGKEYWVGYSIFLPSDGGYDFDYKQNEILNQYRHRDDASCAAVGISPPDALRAQNGRWQWDIRCNDTTCACNGTTRTTIDLGAQQTGKWTDFVIRFTFSSGSDGVLQVWKDGNKVLDRVNKPNYYPNSMGPYIKFGVYKWAWENSSDVNVRTVYFDSIKVYEGTNGYNNVSP
jgi:hypothetical protein